MLVTSTGRPPRPTAHRRRARRAITGAALAWITLPQAAADGGGYPPAIETAIDRGFEIVSEFEAPGGLTGYVGRAQGRSLVLYLTPDGEHVIIGTMRDAAGRNVTRQQIAEHLPPPDMEQAWSLLSEATWVAEGSESPQRVVYAFTDPNCHYCNALWEEAQRYLDRDIQLRHILVSVIKPSSLGKAARILADEDPADALKRHARNFATGGLDPLEEPPADLRRRIERNNRLMERLHVSVTPSLYYRDADGRVERIIGLPDEVGLDEHVFRRPPASD